MAPASSPTRRRGRISIPARVETRRITFSVTTGQYCSTDSQCGTGFCVDSHCCDTACGGNDLTDCQACSVAHGAAVDGTCGIVPGPNIRICRNYANTFCDLREYCDGVNPDCPPDLGRNEGRVCNSSTGTLCPANDATGAPHVCP